MDETFGDMPPLFLAFFGFAALFILVVGVLVATGVVRSRKVLRDSGLGTLTAQAELTARLAQGPLAAPAQSLEQRLAELDDLRRRGVISAAEHEAGRTAALGG